MYRKFGLPVMVCFREVVSNKDILKKRKKVPDSRSNYSNAFIFDLVHAYTATVATSEKAATNAAS